MDEEYNVQLSRKQHTTVLVKAKNAAEAIQLVLEREYGDVFCQTMIVVCGDRVHKVQSIENESIKELLKNLFAWEVTGIHKVSRKENK